MGEEIDPFYGTLDAPKSDDVCPIGGSVCMQLGCYLCNELISQAEHGGLSDGSLRRLITKSIEMANNPVDPCPCVGKVQDVADKIAQHRNLNP